MATFDPSLFRSHFGCDPPAGLLQLLGSQRIWSSLPAGFLVKRSGILIEIQYFMDILDSASFRSEQGQLAFAVTTDGHELVVDLSQNSSEILQDEFGDVDTLGVYIQDLLDAEYTSL